MAMVEGVEPLEDRLTVEDLVNMQRLFQPSESSDEKARMERVEFVAQCCAVIGKGSVVEYGQLFDSVDVSSEGYVDWDRLSSFFLQGLREKDHASAPAVPRWSPEGTLPMLHRKAIHSLTYLPSTGRYFSLGKDATLAVWEDKHLKLLHTHRLTNHFIKPRDLWVTGMVVMPNVHKIAVSCVSKEVCFYNLLSKPEYSLQYKLHGLHHPPISLHYWYDPKRPERAVLSFGDVGGQVSAVCFRSALISLFEHPSAAAGVEQDSTINISWIELQQNRHHCCYTLTHASHNGHLVRTVRFLSSLEAFVSCSSSDKNSLVLARKESKSRPLTISVFNSKEGISDLDYHPGLNLIATAGVNNQVCLWDPRIVSKPVGILRGHMTSVVAVQFMVEKKQLISFSKDKVLKVWDVASERCIQRISGIFPKIQGCKTLLFFHEERSRLFLTFDSSLLVLELKTELELESGRRVMNRESAVTCVLYNSLFRQVISSDASSAVTCWLMDTGQKFRQFSRCHGNAEISAMALDVTQTRLFTAGMDGVVKVWDFNGHCHHILNAGRGQNVKISQILLLKGTVLVVGWERMITVFRLNSFSQYVVAPSEWKGGVQHRDDILCAAFIPDQTLVTGSRDGEIIVWNNSTENALRKLTIHTRHQDLKFKSDSSLSKASTSNDRQSSVSTVYKLPSSALKREEASKSYGITKFAFLEGRKGVASAGGADLVSCGGSGVVSFWNSRNAHLVAEFVAHDNSGSITLTVDCRGRYLATADMEGGVKVWDIQFYCIHPSETVTKQAPPLLSSLRPHVDRVTHLETCFHGDSLFLLSASVDCSLALSFLPGHTIGIFGKTAHWSLERAEEDLMEKEESTREKKETEECTGVQHKPVGPRSPESLEDPGHCVVEKDDDEEQTDTQQPHITCNSDAVQGWVLEEAHGLPMIDRKRLYANRALNSSIGVFTKLRLPELTPVGELTKPDLITNPHLCFETKRESSIPTLPPFPKPRESSKTAFGKKSLFPGEVLEQVDRLLGNQTNGERVGVVKNYGKFIPRTLGKPKASSSGAFKTK
ncbi:cilia- and flagella-associated protein 337-like isoform X2 [Hoplias malabaricus]|uniref:cilia- and flagella-associated protein 337-like isoform X2 n=1 Tax=Hoplias malabaricus TaxID=27720 RepID=UPI003462BA5F